jgi:hypothetical protein
MPSTGTEIVSMGLAVSSIGSGRSTFPQYLRYGVSGAPIANTDWEDALP